MDFLGVINSNMILTDFDSEKSEPPAADEDTAAKKAAKKADKNAFSAWKKKKEC